MKRTVLIFMAKPGQNSFGGNDTFAIQLLEHWPDAEDRLIFAFNAGHPCSDLFHTRLSHRAELVHLNESLIAEKRASLASHYPALSWGRLWREARLDLQRPFLALAAIVRLYRVLGAYHPDAVILNVGGNPPEDLGWRMLIAAWLRRTPRILLVNHSFPGQATNPIRSVALFVLRRLTRFFCDTLVVPSQDMAEATARSMRDTRKPIVIPNGIEPVPESGPSLEEKRTSLRLSRPLAICAVASVEECKGLYYLVDAMKFIAPKHPDVELILIGPPTDKTYLDTLLGHISALGLESQIHYLGYLAKAQQYFECFDVCVVPSIYAESFGIVAIEAMRYAKPIVAARTGGLKDIVVEGDTGYLVPPRDSVALAAALEKLLSSPSLRKTMGERGKERFLSLYVTSKMADRYYQLTHVHPV